MEAEWEGGGYDKCMMCLSLTGIFVYIGADDLCYLIFMCTGRKHIMSSSYVWLIEYHNYSNYSANLRPGLALKLERKNYISMSGAIIYDCI